MLTVVKNQIKVMILSVKYNIMMQMVNKVTFITNILFMILNNASFIIQWIILFNIKNEIGGYNIKQIILLWGLASSVYGYSRVMFGRAFNISELIINGQLDTFLVQPKNVFLSVITSDSKISAIGDLIYGYICLTIYGINIKNFLIFTFFSIIGGIIVTAFAGIVGSLSFGIVKGDAIADVLNNASIHFDTYPGTIFDGGIKILLYTILPVGIANYMPFEIMLRFDFIKFIIVIIFTVCISIFAFIVFNKGLKRYSSSNLMSAKI